MPVSGWLIENGDKVPKYRTMRGGNWFWTSDPNEAIWFVRRADAERVAYEDEDACFIRPHAFMGERPHEKFAQEAQTYEEVYEEFWRDIIELPGGNLNLDQIKRELRDYSVFMGFAARVYNHVTGGKISKINTLPDVVITEADAYYHECCEDDKAEMKELEKENAEPPA